MKPWAGKTVKLIAAMVAALVASTTSARAAEPPASPVAISVEPSSEQAKFFESKVRPLLLQNCVKCHGDDKQKGKLRLDSIAGALKGGENGPAIVPGDVAKSRLVVAIGYKDKDLQMPPDEELAPEQVKILTDWVAMGAPWPKDVALSAAGLPKHKKRTIKDEDRRFWSFVPVKDVAPPAIGGAAAKWVRNPIDQFVLAKLLAEGLKPASEADRITLIRRATFDLHGLPPTPAEIDAFVADTSSDAYEKLIDRLLASPRYGERFARHWMDVVRYAESDGFKQDAFRPNAYLYRDWVIASFNADKPFDHFAKEQIAGDELYPEDDGAAVATGFLRHGMYEYNQKNAEGQWSEYLTDVTDVTSDAFLGLSMGCARCHDHKFDPILQTDYFRLQAFFAPLQPKNDLPAAGSVTRAKYAAALHAWEEKTRVLREEIAKIEAPHRAAIEKRMVERFPPPVQAMMNKAPADRSPYENQIAYLVYQQVAEDMKKLDDRIKGKEKERLLELRKELTAFDADKPKPLPVALAATDVGPTAPPTIIPGDKEKKGLDPGFPVVLDQAGIPTSEIKVSASTTGRRAALAQWIASPANPVTTRVITNRLWQWHFGSGIVRTSSDYGRLGEAPSHPEMLDWLTSRFVQGGWQVKAMHKLIMTSATYRQAGVRAMPEVAKLKDPENRWLWRFNPRRLDAEQIRDAMLAVSGELQLDVTGGPSADYTAPKRTIYTKFVRNTRDPLLDVFDAPEAFGSVANRNSTTTATQSLLMVNGDWPLKRAAAFAQRVSRDAKSADPAEIATHAFRLAYGHDPKPAEREAMVAFLNKSGGPVPIAQGISSAQGSPAAAASAGDINDQPITQLMPQVGGQAILVRSASPADMLKMPRPVDNAPLFDKKFTVEAYVQLESIYENASVRVIASQWNGDQKKAGWSLGVTSEQSRHQPRNLILQLTGDPASAGKSEYEVVPSGLRLELHRVYYVGVAVDLADTSDKGITFWLKDIGDMDAPLRSVKVKHTVTASVASASPLIIGGRDAPGASAPHGWDGLIGEVRICNTALKPDQILYADGDAKDSVVGHWRFEETPGFLKDSTGHMPDLLRVAKDDKPRGPSKGTSSNPMVKVDAALIDLCHVLLNSSEFLYVD